jgi:hypothetical protein
VTVRHELNGGFGLVMARPSDMSITGVNRNGGGSWICGLLLSMLQAEALPELLVIGGGALGGAEGQHCRKEYVIGDFLHLVLRGFGFRGFDRYLAIIFLLTYRLDRSQCASPD